MSRGAASAADVEARTEPAPAAARPAELRTRLLAGLVLFPMFLAAVVVGGVLFLGAILLLAAVATWEFLGLAALKGIPTRRLAGVALALAFPVLLYWGRSSAIEVTALVAAGAIGIALAQLFGSGEEEAIPAVSVTVFAATYVGLLFGHFVLVREIARELPGSPSWAGAALLAVLIGLTWANDTVAYGVGRRWGRRKLMPAVSPAKSVEGALGALAATVALAFPMFWLVDRWVPIFAARDAVALGLLIGVAAPCGDLIESTFKRDAGVKDVSRLLPGHGGVLDRFDSLLVTVPVFYYYLHGVVL